MSTPEGEPAKHPVDLDTVRALPLRKYLRLNISIWLRRYRKKLPRHFRCDCGALYTWSLHEHQHWDQIRTITCHECGDIYRTLQNTIVRIIPNPLHRCLIGDRGICHDHPFSALVERIPLEADRPGSAPATGSR